MREEEGRNSLQKIPFSSFPVGIYLVRGRGKGGGERRKNAAREGRGWCNFAGGTRYRTKLGK